MSKTFASQAKWFDIFEYQNHSNRDIHWDWDQNHHFTEMLLGWEMLWWHRLQSSTSFLSNYATPWAKSRMCVCKGLGERRKNISFWSYTCWSVILNTCCTVSKGLDEHFINKSKVYKYTCSKIPHWQFCSIQREDCILTLGHSRFLRTINISQRKRPSSLKDMPVLASANMRSLCPC